MQEVTVKEYLPTKDIPLIDEDETVKMGKKMLAQTSVLLDQWEEETTLKSGTFHATIRWRYIIKGMIQALPIVIGYIPLAFAYGVMAHEAHLSFFATFLMSLLVLAGASQFVAVSLIAQGQSILAIAFTTFVINLRHLLLATSISQNISRWPAWCRVLFSTALTDETFALHNVWFSENRAVYPQSQATNFTAHAAWILGSCLGFVTGGMFTDIKIFGLDYALAAMFIGILIFQIKNRLMIFIAVLTGSLCVMFMTLGLGFWSVMAAAVTGATTGMFFDLWNKKYT